MASINNATREITCKVVYYGPGMSGKTTNLQMIHQGLPDTNRGQLVSLDTQQERTLFFDFLPIDLGTIDGFTTKFQLYTVPGQVYYNATRKLVLRGVDGVVFVADSQPCQMEENLESLANLRENLAEYGYRLDEIPHVFQHNKQDLPGALSPHDMDAALNPGGVVPSIASVASEGQGVKDTLKIVAAGVLRRLRHQIESLTHAPSPARAMVHTIGAPPAPAGGPPPRLTAQSQQAPPSVSRRMIDPEQLRSRRPQLQRRPSAPQWNLTQQCDVFWGSLRIGRATLRVEPRQNRDGEGAFFIDANVRLFGVLRRSLSGTANPLDSPTAGMGGRLALSGQSAQTCSNGSSPEVAIEPAATERMSPRGWMRWRRLCLVPLGEVPRQWPCLTAEAPGAPIPPANGDDQ